MQLLSLLIDGNRVAAKSGQTRKILNPATGEFVVEAAEADQADTLLAIESAKRAFENSAWKSSSSKDRAQILRKTAEILRRDKSQIAKAESLDTGKRFVESEYDIDDVVNVFEYYADLAENLTSRINKVDRGNIESRIEFEPVGVCGLITPWNYPLLQASWKVAPAIAAGCTFVLKPSELTPTTTSMLMDALAEAGLPAGVGNLILGAGATAGSLLSEHPDVDFVSFTGGVATGKHIMKTASQTVKKVALELGGKNPNIIFADADLSAAIDNALTAVFLHSGQVCSAGARLIVEKSIHDKVVNEIANRAEKIVLGGPFEANAETGSLISKAHLEKIEKYVENAIKEGAKLVAGGRRPSESHLQDGYFYRPTVLDDCNSKMQCVQDESFGPILTVETFETEVQAISIANDTIYGLAGAVWSQDSEKSNRVAKALRHGTIWINDYHPYVPQAEWGGFKQSGVGRELGPSGLAEYLEPKHIWQNLKPAPSGWFSEGDL
ncbi:MAG: aldehyde dehydrogenase family protein [Candidatus Nanopelagicales bacterium]